MVRIFDKATDDPFKPSDWDELKKETVKANLDGKGVKKYTRIVHREKNQHDGSWKFKWGLLAAIETVFSLGLALLCECTKHNWERALSGRDVQVVYIRGEESESTDAAEEIECPDLEPTHGGSSHSGIVVDAPELKLIKDAEDVAFKISMDIGKLASPSAVQMMKKCDYKAMLKIYDEIFEHFKSQDCKNRWGATYNDEQFLLTPIGGKVDVYFANVDSGSTEYNKKVRSLLGLRNLLRFGPEILDELKDKLFIAGEHHYQGNGFDIGKGLYKMKYYTGNTVDLETDLGKDKGGADLARYEARDRIAMFIEEFKEHFSPGLVADFSSDKAKKDPLYLQGLFVKYKLELDVRKLYVDPYNTTLSAHNTDRGNTGLWLYQLTNHYNVNVPATTDVINVMIKLPYIFAQSYILIKASATSPQDLRNKLLDFFDKSLSTKCFNDKLKQIEKFNKEECRSKYLKILTPAEKNRKEAVQKYGEKAVYFAEKKNKIDVFRAKFIEDEALLPPEKARKPKDKWIADALPLYIEKAKDKGLWKKAVFYRDPELIPPLPGETYSLFDEVAIRQLMEQWTYCDSDDRIS